MGHVEEHLRWIAELLGRKLLVPGNHDRCWSRQSRLRAGLEGRTEDDRFNRSRSLFGSRRPSVTAFGVSDPAMTDCVARGRAARVAVPPGEPR